MKLKDIFKDKKTMVFKVVNDYIDNERDIEIEPTNFMLIPDDENHYIIRALEVRKGKISSCFMDIITPERIAEIVIRKGFMGTLKINDYYNFEGVVIPAVASDCFGIYELYYANENPQIGIDILKEGLEIAKNKEIVSEDLGYILRDEHRNDEAIEAFKKSIEYGSSTPYAYLELSHLYERLGNIEMKNNYHQLFLENGGKQINFT